MDVISDPDVANEALAPRDVGVEPGARATARRGSSRACPSMVGALAADGAGDRGDDRRAATTRRSRVFGDHRDRCRQRLVRRTLRRAAERGAGADPVRPLHRIGDRGRLVVVQSVREEAEGVAAGSELPERADQGQRRERQPDRDRGGRRVADHRHRQGRVRRRRLRAVRDRAERDLAPPSRQRVPLRRLQDGQNLTARQRATRSATRFRPSSRPACNSPASRSSRPG